MLDWSGLGRRRMRDSANQGEHDDSTSGRLPEIPAAERTAGELRSVESLLRLAAYHQAGHAAMATMLGVQVLSAELSEGPPPSGQVRVRGLEEDDEQASDRGLVRLLAYRLAGPIAEAIAEAGSRSLQGDPGSRAATTIMGGFRAPDTIDRATDHGAAAGLLREHFGDGEEQAATAVEHLTINVEGWVRDNWHAIALVASSLLRHRRLTLDEFRSILPPLEPMALP